jgi:hypothetical protein
MCEGILGIEDMSKMEEVLQATVRQCGWMQQWQSCQRSGGLRK